MNIFKDVDLLLSKNNINIISKNVNKPWGGYYLINESQTKIFSNLFFNKVDISELINLEKLSSKILIIKPKKRLSWQYHYRRSEIWSVIKGSIKVIKSDDNTEKDKFILNEGEQIEIKKEERHRIVGLDDYALVAEIWIHTDKENPSNEEDIVRVQDDFDRK